MAMQAQQQAQAGEGLPQGPAHAALAAAAATNTIGATQWNMQVLFAIVKAFFKTTTTNKTKL